MPSPRRNSPRSALSGSQSVLVSPKPMFGERLRLDEGTPLSEVMIRVALAQARRAIRPAKTMRTSEALHIFRELRDLTEHQGFLALSSWHAAIAWAASEGVHPAHYTQDVLRRARAHQRNVARGKPWTKQR